MKYTLETLPKQYIECIYWMLRSYATINVSYKDGRIQVSPNACLSTMRYNDFYNIGSFTLPTICDEIARRNNEESANIDIVTIRERLDEIYLDNKLDEYLESGVK